MGKRPLTALTGIRFFLAFWVVIYHQLQSVDLSFLPPPTPALFHTGYTAVTAFFVLSGFVLAYNYSLQAPLTPPQRARFFTARFSRIYPAYLVGLLLLTPLAFYRIWAGIPIAHEWSHFFANLFLLQAWFPQTALTWNFPGWSLSNEMFFYATFPFLGVWLWNIRTSRLWLAFFALWGLSSLAPLIAVWIPLYHWGDLPASLSTLPDDISIWANVVRYNPLLRLPEFCTGILVAKLFSQSPPRNGALIYLPALLLTLALLLCAEFIPYPLLHNGLALPLFAALLFGLASGHGLFAQWLSTPLMGLLGDASYSMYILHAPIYSWLGLFFRYILLREPAGWIWFSAYAATVVGTACIFFKLVEEPLHRSLRTWLDRRIIKT